MHPSLLNKSIAFFVLDDTSEFRQLYYVQYKMDVNFEIYI